MTTTTTTTIMITTIIIERLIFGEIMRLPNPAVRNMHDNERPENRFSGLSFVNSALLTALVRDLWA